MTSLKELISARNKLDADIAKARQQESAAALTKVHELIAEFGFTSMQVFPWKPAAAKVQPKYRDEKSGATWTGRGKAPAWIAGKNRNEFLIEKTLSTPAQGPFLAEMAAAAAATNRRP